MYYETKDSMLLGKAVFHKQIERKLLILYDQLKKIIQTFKYNTTLVWWNLGILDNYNQEQKI